MNLALVAADGAATLAPDGEADALLGFDSVTLCIARPDATFKLLTETFGYRQTGERDDVLRFHAAGEGIGTALEIRADDRCARPGGGIVLQVACLA